MVEFCVEFEAIDNSFETEFEGFTPVSDGGYDRGYAEGYAQGDADGQIKGKAEGQEIGYADALAKRTDLVATANGEYTPSEDSTGFKSVSVNVQAVSKLPKVVDRTITEITAEDLGTIRTVGYYAFYNCTNLKKVHLTERINAIRTRAFYNCSALKTLKLGAINPPTITTDSLYNCNALTEIIVPIGSREAYKAATNWSAYADIIVEGDV